MGRRVLVTGGTRGIGRAISETFLRAGAEVVAGGRSAPKQPVAFESRKATFVSADIRTADGAAQLIQEAIAALGGLDVLINNAGGSPYALAADASPRFHEKVLALNLMAPLHLAQAAYHEMCKDRGGSIVNIASVSGVRPSPGTAAYGAAKAGLLSLTQSLAVEWAPRVRVNAIVAGLVQTEHSLEHYGGAAGLARVEKTVPLGRFAAPEEIGMQAAYLASDASAYITGASIEMHGGNEEPAFLAAAQGRPVWVRSAADGSDPEDSNPEQKRES